MDAHYAVPPTHPEPNKPSAPDVFGETLVARAFVTMSAGNTSAASDSKSAHGVSLLRNADRVYGSSVKHPQP
ncbi:hypothetical protein BDV32DRAFT_146275 [Aspergillus pseudonomiae]|nr:hypothetical protein BDV32DRAFT_146275 [Aspergillus pseudonomiae]